MYLLPEDSQYRKSEHFATLTASTI